MVKHLRWPRRWSILSGEAILVTRARFFLVASLALWGCRSRAPEGDPSQPTSPQAVTRPPADRPLVGGARPAGVAVRIPTRGGIPGVYRLPDLAEIPNVIHGRLPAVDGVVGLDPESEFLFVMTDKKDLVSLDLGSGRVDTVVHAIGQAALGPDGTLYTVDAKRRVVSVARRGRVAWPHPPGGGPPGLFRRNAPRLPAVDSAQIITP